MYNLRGYAYYFIGEFDKAEADYRKVLESNPDHLITLSDLLLLLIAVKRYEEAEKMRGKMEKRYPDQMESWIEATFYASKKYWQKTKNCMKKTSENMGI